MLILIREEENSLIMRITELIKSNDKIYIFSLYAYRVIANIKADFIKQKSDKRRRALLSNLYKKRTGKALDWSNLRSYTEKMQWAKLYENDKIKKICSDKYEVREYVASRVGEDILIPLLGSWQNVKDIDYDILPNQFVLKTTNGSGSNIIVKNKNGLNVKLANAKLLNWQRTKYAYLHGYELQYDISNPRVIAEEFLDCGLEDLIDYKFLCFNGKAYYCWVDTGRYHHHQRTVYDLNWKKQEWNQRSYGNCDIEVMRPINFDRMIDIANTLAEGFSHVRIDLYNLDGKIYFGEMTFTNGSGFELITPENANLMLGDLWKLNMDSKEKNRRSVLSRTR